MAIVESDFWRAAPVVNSAGLSARNWVTGKDFFLIRPDIHGIQVVQATQGKTPISMVNPLNALSMSTNHLDMDQVHYLNFLSWVLYNPWVLHWSLWDKLTGVHSSQNLGGGVRNLEIRETERNSDLVALTLKADFSFAVSLKYVKSFLI